MAAKLSSAEKGLIRRYLLWCYKSTKESLDRVDRKFTQVKVDRQLLKYLNDQGRGHEDEKLARLISDFEKYVNLKEQEGTSQKFLNPKIKTLNADYLYLHRRLTAIERTIVYFLGARVLSAIKMSYEQEMTRRILESREH